MTPADQARADQRAAYLRDLYPKVVRLTRVVLEDACDLRALGRRPTPQEAERFAGHRLLNLRAFLLRTERELHELGDCVELVSNARQLLAQLDAVDAALAAAQDGDG